MTKNPSDHGQCSNFSSHSILNKCCVQKDVQTTTFFLTEGPGFKKQMKFKDSSRMLQIFFWKIHWPSATNKTFKVKKINISFSEDAESNYFKDFQGFSRPGPFVVSKSKNYPGLSQTLGTPSAIISLDQMSPGEDDVTKLHFPALSPGFPFSSCISPTSPQFHFPIPPIDIYLYFPWSNTNTILIKCHRSSLLTSATQRK